MTTSRIVLSIAVMAGVTFLTRVLPFLLFDRGGEPPKVIHYLGEYLPPAVMAMLVVYCYRSMTFDALGNWLPGVIAGITVVVLHVWKRNNMLSIVGGTILYMVLIQGVF